MRNVNWKLSLFAALLFLCFPFVLFGCATSAPDRAKGTEPKAQTVNIANQAFDYSEIEKSFLNSITYENYQVHDSSGLTPEILENRNGIVIIERCIGAVLCKENGDGVLINAPNPPYNYIYYNCEEMELEDGSLLISYMVYNPQNNFVDDIIERYDFVLSRIYERDY